MLDVDERRTFTELSVFAGSVSAADVAEVMGSERPSHVAFTLGSLADRSLLVAATDGPSTRYRMLSTVRAVAGRWLDDDMDAAADVRRRHAVHFAGVVRTVDHVIRTPNEIEGRQRLATVADEIRTAHYWAQRYEPELAADISGALHLAAYSTFWNEPVEWARLLLAQHPAATTDDLLGARLIVAGSAANRGDLGVARAEVAGVSRSDNLRMRAAAAEILSDVGLYAGDLDGVAASTDELRLLGAELGDSHWEVIAAVNAALALTFADRPGEAIERLAEVEPIESSPSDCAWATYARGEALSALGEPGATDAYSSAIDLARAVGNPFVESVSQVALASEYSRAGSHRQALDAFAECLHAYARHGNYVHAVTTLRNMIEVLAAIGDNRGAAVIGAATSSDLLRKSYGPEAERLALHLWQQRSSSTSRSRSAPDTQAPAHEQSEAEPAAGRGGCPRRRQRNQHTMFIPERAWVCDGDRVRRTQRNTVGVESGHGDGVSADIEVGGEVELKCGCPVVGDDGCGQQLRS